MQVLFTPPGNWEEWRFLIRNPGPVVTNQHSRSWVSVAPGPSIFEKPYKGHVPVPPGAGPVPLCSLSKPKPLWAHWGLDTPRAPGKLTGPFNPATCRPP